MTANELKIAFVDDQRGLPNNPRFVRAAHFRNMDYIEVYGIVVSWFDPEHREARTAQFSYSKNGWEYCGETW